MITAVYLPTGHESDAKLADQVRGIFDSIHNVWVRFGSPSHILGGDLNGITSLEDTNDPARSPSAVLLAAMKLLNLQDLHDLSPKLIKQFTFDGPIHSSRIDAIWISPSLSSPKNLVCEKDELFLDAQDHKIVCGWVDSQPLRAPPLSSRAPRRPGRYVLKEGKSWEEFSKSTLGVAEIVNVQTKVKERSTIHGEDPSQWQDISATFTQFSKNVCHLVRKFGKKVGTGAPARPPKEVLLEKTHLQKVVGTLRKIDPLLQESEIEEAILVMNWPESLTSLFTEFRSEQPRSASQLYDDLFAFRKFCMGRWKKAHAKWQKDKKKERLDIYMISTIKTRPRVQTIVQLPLNQPGEPFITAPPGHNF
jgi:hypothetical protein